MNNHEKRQIWNDTFALKNKNTKLYLIDTTAPTPAFYSDITRQVYFCNITAKGAEETAVHESMHEVLHKQVNPETSMRYHAVSDYVEIAMEEEIRNYEIQNNQVIPVV